jgi:hypothetical protein
VRYLPPGRALRAVLPISAPMRSGQPLGRRRPAEEVREETLRAGAGGLG